MSRPDHLTVSNIRSDPRGYTHVATFSNEGEAERGRRMLEGKGIEVRLDDHSYRIAWGVPRDWGHIRFLVPDERVPEAVELLRSHVAEEQRHRYMRLTS